MTWFSRNKSQEPLEGMAAGSGNVWVDSSVIGGLIVLLNSIASPKDIGWFQSNPSPYFLMPILIGSRYGFASGIASGLATSAGLLAITMARKDIPFASTLETHGYFFGALIVIGGVCGEIQNTFKKSELQARAQNDRYKARLKKLDSDTVLLRGAKAELERLLATRDSALSTLETDIRRLFDSEGDDVFQNILFLLNRQARITDAAIYILDSGGDLLRRASIGMTEHLPERMGLADNEMGALAWNQKQCVTIAEFWEGAKSERSPHIAAVPFMDSEDRPIGLLLVTGIPFIALNQKTLHLVDLICRWSSRVVELRGPAAHEARVLEGMENQKVLFMGSFMKNLELTHSSFEKHGLPSSVVVLFLPGKPKSLQAAFERLVVAEVRNGDFPVDVSPNVPSLAILLPLTGERGASIFLTRMLSACRKKQEIGPAVESVVLTFSENETCAEFWERVIDYVETGPRNH